jgi:kynurenine aminotransferase
VVITCGATEALLSIIMGYCDPGDEVIYFEPFFPWYARMVKMVGAINVVIPLKLINDQLRPDFTLLEKSVTKRTKLVIWNTPHNPTGFVATKEEILTLSNIVMKHNLLLISDEVYEAHTFPSEKCEHHRVARFEGMWERTITLGSASKLFSLTGWRIGWAIGPREVLAPVDAIHGTSTFCAPTPLQLSISAAFDEEKNYTEVP